PTATMSRFSRIVIVGSHVPSARTRHVYGSKKKVLRNLCHITSAIAAASFVVPHSFRKLYVAPLLPCPLPKVLSRQRPIGQRSALSGELNFVGLGWSSSI